MVTQFDAWLKQVSAHLGLEDQTKSLRLIREQANFSVKAEDKFAQRRQVMPGDYKRKLRNETIDQLNRIFASILERLDYKI